MSYIIISDSPRRLPRPSNRKVQLSRTSIQTPSSITRGQDRVSDGNGSIDDPNPVSSVSRSITKTQTGPSSKNPAKTPVTKRKAQKAQKAQKARKTLSDKGAVSASTECLPACRTVEDIRELRAAQTQRFLRKAMAGIDFDTKRESLGSKYDDCLLAIAGGGTNIPTLASDRARTDAFEHTGRALSAMLQDNPGWEVVFVSIVSGDGVTSSNAPVIDIQNEINKAKGFARHVSPHYIGAVESVLFNSHTHEAGGRIIQVHSHMLMVGEGVIAKAEAAKKTYGPKLPRNHNDAPQVLVKEVDTDEINLMRMASYLFKPPHKAKTWCPERGDKRGHMHESEKGDRMILYFRMATILSMIPLDKAIFAGGACKAIKSGVVNDIRANARSGCPNPNRMLAPDTIGSMWVEVSKDIGLHEWRLPVIIIR